jgi:predicted protein tyrosine phosphatase
MSSAQSKKRVLFVCTHNRVRSATAEYLYRGRRDLEVRSAGIAKDAAVPLSRELFEWAGYVFVFSTRQLRFIERRYGGSSNGKKVVCLNLADEFEYRSPELIIALTERLWRHLGAPARHAPTGTKGHSERPESHPAEGRILRSVHSERGVESERAKDMFEHAGAADVSSGGGKSVSDEEYGEAA